MRVLPKKNSLSERDTLIRQKFQALQSYRTAVRWACNALDYKRRFEREEDYGADDLQDNIKELKEDSRLEIKRVAVDIKILRSQIKSIDKRLMDLGRPVRIMLDDGEKEKVNVRRI